MTTTFTNLSLSRIFIYNQIIFMDYSLNFFDLIFVHWHGSHPDLKLSLVDFPLSELLAPLMTFCTTQSSPWTCCDIRKVSIKVFLNLKWSFILLKLLYCLNVFLFLYIEVTDELYTYTPEFKSSMRLFAFHLTLIPFFLEWHLPNVG